MKNPLNTNEQKMFYTAFGISFNKFLDITGFDIVKFDKYIQTPAGISMKDFIAKEHGEEVSKIIEKLIDFYYM